MAKKNFFQKFTEQMGIAPIDDVETAEAAKEEEVEELEEVEDLEDEESEPEEISEEDHLSAPEKSSEEDLEEAEPGVEEDTDLTDLFRSIHGRMQKASTGEESSEDDEESLEEDESEDSEEEDPEEDDPEEDDSEEDDPTEPEKDESSNGPIPHFFGWNPPVVGNARGPRRLEFYDRLKDDAYEYDRTGSLSDELLQWIEEAITEDEVLSASFIAVLPNILDKHPEYHKEIQKIAITHSEETVPYEIRWSNKKRPDGRVYDSFDKAVESIRELVDAYGVDPTEVFEIHYVRRDGEVCRPVDKSEVVKFINDEYLGNKTELRKKLQINKPAANRSSSKKSNIR